MVVSNSEVVNKSQCMQSRISTIVSKNAHQKVTLSHIGGVFLESLSDGRGNDSEIGSHFTIFEAIDNNPRPPVHVIGDRSRRSISQSYVDNSTTMLGTG